MSSRFIRVVCVVFSLCIAAVLHAQPDLTQLVRQSHFIFLGTVRQTGAANMAGIAPSPSNAIVTVERVLSAPERLGDFTGRDVTILLLQAGSPKAGQRAVFFTNGWIYGKTLAVREVAHRDSAGEDPEALRSSITDATRRGTEEDLAALLAKADLVVAGTVTRIESVAREQFRLPLTEHDPELARAFVRVETVIKGRLVTGGSVSFLFARSRDVMWEQSPKVKEGQSAIWILSRDEKNGLKLDALTAFDRRDVRSPNELDLIRRLLGKGNQR